MVNHRTIWKFLLEDVDHQYVEMPQGSEILSVHIQRGAICLWAKVDPRNPVEKRGVWVHGTGHVVDFSRNHGPFIGTFLTDGETHVYHVFEDSRREG